ncbi:hypothetical protein DI09_187p30, partial [Mitosporidium daphniae]
MGEMSHQLPGGPSLGERVTEAGFEWRSIAENIAAKVSDVDDVMQAWMNSPGISSLHLILGHRQNILGSFEYFGAAQMPALSAEQVERLRVVDLREELSSRGLQTSGLKKDLVARLLEALQGEGSSQDGALSPTSKGEDLSAQSSPQQQPSGQISEQPESLIIRKPKKKAHASGDGEHDFLQEKLKMDHTPSSEKILAPVIDTIAQDSNMDMVDVAPSANIHTVFEESTQEPLSTGPTEPVSIDTQPMRVECDQMAQAEDLVKESQLEAPTQSSDKENQQMVHHIKSDVAESRNPLAILFEVNTKLGSEKSLSITRLLPPFSAAGLQHLLERWPEKHGELLFVTSVPLEQILQTIEQESKITGASMQKGFNRGQKRTFEEIDHAEGYAERGERKYHPQTMLLQQGSEDEGSSFEDIFDDIEDEDTIFDPSLLDGCDTEEDSDQQDVNMMHSKKAIPLSSIGKFSDLKIEEQEQDEQEDTTPRRTYLPSMHVDKDNQLDVNPSVYNLFRELTIEWPCLSFDFLSTDVNENGNLSVSIVAGSQAASSSKNRLYYIKASNLKVLKKKHSIDSGYLSSSSDNSSSDEDEHQVNVKCKASSPALSSISVPHQGCVNRVRVSRATGIPAYVASWSDLGKIYIWNSEDHLRQLDDPVNSLKYSFIGEDLKKRHKAVKNNSTASLAVMTDHGTDEGYALAWSIKGTPGRILSGDCSGKIVMSQLGEATFTPLGKLLNPSCSVEDLSWSTIEAEIFASADTSGMVKIWDTRQALSPVATIHASACDVNVISWNPSSTFLLASGADDGEWATWDLRKVFTASPSKSDPLVSFRWHQAPIS